MLRAKNVCHTTAEEIKFLETIGNNSDQGRDLGKRELLRRYVEAMKKRKVWGDASAAPIKKWIKDRLLNAAR